ncbi:hypothetical protein VNO80_04728 [Phaseolus coccineus]|uniref:Uncharacterized protein n=1 Tax=Phaseolus coccineus TaxID=3886 RepID=A0AAN9NUQ9_PHACN
MREKEETLGKEKGVQGLSIPAPTLKTLVEDANTCSNPKRHLVPLLVILMLVAQRGFNYEVLNKQKKPVTVCRWSIIKIHKL